MPEASRPIDSLDDVMPYRRIVTGHDPDGHSVFTSDGPAPREFTSVFMPGFSAALVWDTRPDASLPAAGDDPSLSATRWVPGPGGTNMMFVTFPPDSVARSQGFDVRQIGAEHRRFMPGLADAFEAENPGMHTTDTVDYGVLLDGEIHLELDNGATKRLAPRDVVVQNGTRHAWRNRSDHPATMLFVMVGTRRG